MKLSTSKILLCHICENKDSQREKSFFPPTLAKINVCEVIPNEQFARMFSSLDL